jgi:hypothetical protein
MYAAGRPHDYKHACIDILSHIEKGNIEAAIDTEIIQEILHRYHSIGLHKEAIKLSWNILDLGIEILELKTKDLELALHYYEKYYREGIYPRDAIHTAVMVNNDLTEIISTDKHFDKIEEVKRIDPKDFIKKLS